MNQLDSIIPIIVPVLFGIVIIIFIVALKRKNAPHSQEKGRVPVYTESCGAWIGMTKSTFPFVRVSVYDGFLVIGLFTGPILIRFDENTSAVIEKVLIKEGLVIKHRQEGVPERIVIWSFNKEVLLRHLVEQMGKSRPG